VGGGIRRGDGKIKQGYDVLGVLGKGKRSDHTGNEKDSGELKETGQTGRGGGCLQR